MGVFQLKQMVPFIDRYSWPEIRRVINCLSNRSFMGPVTVACHLSTWQLLHNVSFKGHDRVANLTARGFVMIIRVRLRWTVWYIILLRSTKFPQRDSCCVIDVFIIHLPMSFKTLRCWETFMSNSAIHGNTALWARSVQSYSFYKCVTKTETQSDPLSWT